MTSLTDTDIDRIARGVIDGTLPKPEWTHAAHFAAALWMITRHGADAERQMPGLIRAYNEATNTPNTDTGGYHETITLASLRAARFMLATHPDTALSDVLAALMAREFGKSGWLLAYWRRETLFSVEARREWVEPDVQALGF
ncbi:MAG: hypothetical protein QM773_20355 [Hyphomonadaceae bacterium]